jgi:hypothetical protein
MIERLQDLTSYKPGRVQSSHIICQTREIDDRQAFPIKQTPLPIPHPNA